MSENQSSIDRRTGDPYSDRRSGDDRRKVYDLDFFEQGGIERRRGIETRQIGERRAQCVEVSQWSSVCPKTKSSGLKSCILLMVVAAI